VALPRHQGLRKHVRLSRRCAVPMCRFIRPVPPISFCSSVWAQLYMGGAARIFRLLVTVQCCSLAQPCCGDRLRFFARKKHMEGQLKCVEAISLEAEGRDLGTMKRTVEMSLGALMMNAQAEKDEAAIFKIDSLANKVGCVLNARQEVRGAGSLPQLVGCVWRLDGFLGAVPCAQALASYVTGGFHYHFAARRRHLESFSEDCHFIPERPEFATEGHAIARFQISGTGCLATYCRPNQTRRLPRPSAQSAISGVRVSVDGQPCSSPASFRTETILAISLDHL
jgi:hypothetical protein